ncbi:MAG: zinc metallopeptidase, partial [Planctomycetota bacterium]|nr:zinc metallopeptidase [Planctomycetota bacterium]
MPFYGMDPLQMLIGGVCLVISLIAQGLVKSAFARYSRVANSRRLSGAEAARRMLSAEGVTDVAVNRHPGGWLSDHYHP